MKLLAWVDGRGGGMKLKSSVVFPASISVSFSFREFFWVKDLEAVKLIDTVLLSVISPKSSPSTRIQKNLLKLFAQVSLKLMTHLSYTAILIRKLLTNPKLKSKVKVQFDDYVFFPTTQQPTQSPGSVLNKQATAIYPKQIFDFDFNSQSPNQIQNKV